MSKRLSRAAVIKKTAQLGFSTIVNKGIGFIREMLTARYLGVGVIADAYFAAYRLPSSLRKIFAEGAFAGAVVPTLTQVYKERGEEETSRVVSALLIIVQVFLLGLSLVVAWQAPRVIALIVPGWANSVLMIDRLALTSFLLRILIFFIVFTSAATLISVTLQVVNFFSLLVLSQLVTNVLLSFQLYVLLRLQLPVFWFAASVILDSILVLFLCVIMYRSAGFRFLKPSAATWQYVSSVLKKFLPACIGLGAVEITLIIDQIIASYLPQGSLALLKYVYAFMRLPLGLFAATFATILLPQFARVYAHAPKRINFYFFEALKVIWWACLPATILMIAFSYRFFYTFYFCERFPIERVYEAANLLSWLISGLFFFALDKIVVSLFYARHDMVVPTIATLLSASLNTALSVVLIWQFGYGIFAIIIALVVSVIVKVAYAVWMLHRKYQFNLYVARFSNFCIRSFFQNIVVFSLFWVVYLLLELGITSYFPATIVHLLLWTALYWLWVGPLVGLSFFVLFKTRKLFSLRLYFLA